MTTRNEAGVHSRNHWSVGLDHVVGSADIVEAVTDDVCGDSVSIRRGLESSVRHELFDGEGRFVDERTVEVSGDSHSHSHSHSDLLRLFDRD